MEFDHRGYPYWNQLGISTQWCAFAPGEQALYYFIVVQNNSEYPLQYAFVEADSDNRSLRQLAIVNAGYQI
jgi:hypothetical protein